MYGDAYATRADLEVRMESVPDAADSLLEAASRRVEWFTGRQFNKDTGVSPVATERQFRPIDYHRLPVDDFHTLTDLVVEQGGTVVDLTTIDARPWNSTLGEASPYSDLMRSSWRYSPFRRPTVSVTAHWGWAAVPEAIKAATCDVAMALMSSMAPAGPVERQAIDGYSIQYASAGLTAGRGVPVEFAAAEPYRRKRFGVA